mmetsp:Transcript_55875/g.126056  ORF Transcript_55875/g.126056 Transcript_55875/m.126056 type:complete len:139 (+) Transcript_55875:88-504(+)|eukprot:CAMPEP_0197874948 /NCGR_PEP_ID=MMETSP1439-20131203/4325_1 /TAXON_ID=66791 /ORGANISM="Gonyaulax spinifera, Strain CCMP409" /LENGTH=138 /DNA_ID=CAMNT_0043494119 /DNA_START=56 /DNA_END=475 /DNA_ORIENTATION=-
MARLMLATVLLALASPARTAATSGFDGTALLQGQQVLRHSAVDADVDLREGSRMDPTMAEAVVKAAQEALDSEGDDTKVQVILKDKLQKAHGGNWQVIMGDEFAASVTTKTGRWHKFRLARKRDESRAKIFLFFIYDM